MRCVHGKEETAAFMMVSSDWDECVRVSVCVWTCAFERECRGGRQAAEQSRVNDNCLKTLQLNLLGERDFGHKYWPELLSKLKLGFKRLKLCLVVIWTKRNACYIALMFCALNCNCVWKISLGSCSCGADDWKILGHVYSMDVQAATDQPCLGIKLLLLS